jgi:pimeloyl-ACP methyl ester carboxylesterase
VRALAKAGARTALAGAQGGHGFRQCDQRSEQTPRQGVHGSLRKVRARAPSDPSDFLTTLEADLGHDTTDRLPELSSPTLIIGGSDDPFFPESLLRETAGKIPGAELCVYEGVGHGVPKERKRRYEDDALAFLSERRISV